MSEHLPDLVRELASERRVILRNWNPRRGLWMNRLWSAVTLHGWLKRPSGGRASPGHVSGLAVDLLRAVADVERLLAEEGVEDGQGLRSPDYVVWRDAGDLWFVALTRGGSEPRRLGDLVSGVSSVSRQPVDDTEGWVAGALVAPKAGPPVGRSTTFVVVRDGLVFSVLDTATGDIVARAMSDPLGLAVGAAQSAGLPWMTLRYNHEDVRPQPGVILAMDAGDDLAVPVAQRRRNPLEQRREVQERAARRGPPRLGGRHER